MTTAADISDFLLWQRRIARTDEDAAALKRLATSVEARTTWQRLIALEESTPSRAGLLAVAASIAREVATADALPSEMRTKREIGQAAKDAAYHARALVRIIEENASLSTLGEDFQMPGEAILSPLHHAAMYRILTGALEEGVRNKQNDGRIFSAEVESALDEWQEYEFPEARGLTSAMAYQLLQAEEMRTLGGLVTRLEGFEALAMRSADAEPIVPRPNADSAKAHALALRLCRLMKIAYGSPRYEIVAGFVSAALNRIVDQETVKKWWQRDSSVWK